MKPALVGVVKSTPAVWKRYPAASTTPIPPPTSSVRRVSRVE
jgi:hypothetical protein